MIDASLLGKHDRVVVVAVDDGALEAAADDSGLEVVHMTAANDLDETVALLVSLIGDGRSTLLAAPSPDDAHPDRELAGSAASTAAVRTGATLVELSPVGTWRRREPADTALDDLHQSEADPWGVDTRWYERRKRALTLAMLPRPRFVRAREVGCSVGARTAALADRCDEVVGVDGSASAVEAAQARLADAAHVDVRRALVPGDWPAGEFDLVVVSEMAYFLSPAALEGLAARIRDCLTADGVVVACHWRHDIEGWVLDGADAHARLLAELGLPEQSRYEDRDITLSLLGRDDALPDPTA